MDSFELNKILGAVLAACLVVLLTSFAASAVFTTKMPAKPGFEIAVKEESHGGGGGAAAASSEPIEKLLQTASVEGGAYFFDELLKGLSPANHPLAVKLASLPDEEALNWAMEWVTQL